MQIRILLFGILRDVIGSGQLNMAVLEGTTLTGLKLELTNEYPKLNEYQNYALAVNEAYAENDYALKENDVVALIPPVSGG